MNYLVLETHPAYAVLLDERGRFVKAANRGYRVGDRVQDPVLLQAAGAPSRSALPPRAARWPGWRPVSAWYFSATTNPTLRPTARCGCRSTRKWSWR